MEKNVQLAAPCGLYCGECNFYRTQCAGCAAIKGKPFWAEQFGVEVCPLYDCPVNKNKLEHCGECGTFPCETFLTMRDPSQTDEQFNESLEQRRAVLQRRREIGTAAWLEERHP